MEFRVQGRRCRFWGLGFLYLGVLVGKSPESREFGLPECVPAQ